MGLIDEAVVFSAKAHFLQRRKSIKIPYFSHCMEVMKEVSYCTQDETVLIIAILHDVLEDTDVGYEEILLKFNKKIADGVLDCSRDGGDNVSKYKKYEFLNSFHSKSKESILVKLYDRLCNSRDYGRTPKKRSYASQYALQAWPLYQAFYNRKEEFEDLCIVKNVEDCIFELGSIVRNVYDVNIFNTNYEEVKKIVL